MSLSFQLPRELESLREEAVRVAAATEAAGRCVDDSWLVGHDPDFARELGRRGWLGMTWPEAAGGGGRPAIERAVVFEALIAGGAPVASCWLADRQIGPTLLEFGTEAQRRRFLPGILDGSAQWAIGMSEPDAGSDVSAIRTRAEACAAGYRVNGQKLWTSGAATADHLYLIARTDPDAPSHRGLSEFVVDLHSHGITVRAIKDLTGESHFCEVHLEDVVVPAENLVGEPNNSFRQAMRQMEHERGGIDRLVSNWRLYRDVLAAADTSDPIIRQEIAAIESGYRIGRLLVFREALGQAPAGYSAATKCFCAELEQRVAAFCARALGPATLDTGCELGRRAARSVAFARGYTIMGGTAEVLRNVMGERLLGLPR